MQEGLRTLLHEAATPLAIVSGNAQLLAEVGTSDPDLAAPCVADLVSAADDLAATLARLAALRDACAPPGAA